MNVNRKPENSEGFCFPKGLWKNELFSQETYHSQNLRYETSKSPLLKKPSVFRLPLFVWKPQCIECTFLSISLLTEWMNVPLNLMLLEDFFPADTFQKFFLLFSYTDDIFITWYLFSNAEYKSDKVVTCWEILAWEFYNVPAFAVFDKFVKFFFAYYLSSLLLLTSKCSWPFDSKKLPSVKPKLKSATGVNWITVCQVSKYTDICLLFSCMNTGFRTVNKECHINCVDFQ